MDNFITSFECFTAVIFQFEVICIVTSCSVVVGYQRFRGPCCLHLQGKVAGRERLRVILLLTVSHFVCLIFEPLFGSNGHMLTL
jgi:hypothetical protein